MKSRKLSAGVSVFGLAGLLLAGCAPEALVLDAQDPRGRNAAPTPSTGSRLLFAGAPTAQPASAPAAYEEWGQALSTGGTDVVNDEAFDAMFFEEYGVNPFVDTDEDNLSTFAVDVDTGSYTLMRSYIERGHLPPDESVRVEEYVNFFDQDYPPPADAEEPFSIHVEGAPSHFGTELHSLVRIGLQGYMPSSDDRPDVVLTFVIDVSGSMSLETRLELVKDALLLLIDQLRPSDQIGIAVYGSNGRILLPHTPVAESTTITRAIQRLQPEGSTNAEEGLIVAYQMARDAFLPDAINRVILCSDGVANVGNTGADSIWHQIQDYADQGIYLTTVGFGMGNYNDVLMEQLADQGDGFYAYVDTIEEAQRLFCDRLPSTLQVIARDAKIQVEFNPSVVRSYRLIGYENRDIADDDFRDDKVDAGEIGIGHSVTALYEIKPWTQQPSDETAITVYVRYLDPLTGQSSEITSTSTLSAFAASFAQASPRFQLSAVVAEFAEILRNSFWATGSSLDAVLTQARRVQEYLPQDDDVAEFVTLVQSAVEISGQEDHTD
jgi:Ca-activated chloride channel family protein